MDAQSLAQKRSTAVWLDPASGDFEAFRAQVARTTDPADWPLAAAVAKRVPIYDGAEVRAAAADEADRRTLMAEWTTALDTGPGVIVIRGAVTDMQVLDTATHLFDTIIDREKAESGGGGDHFAKPGANDRIWNAAEKHCLADPLNFARYYATDAIAMAAEAWLGPGYQITAQVNRVNPGGAAQTAHRDYHLGFMTPDRMSAYPAHIHRISPLLTLQGGIAHCDMPVESGPTVFLPYSQRFFEGYLAFSRPEFQDHFARHHVQLPLSKGDAVFFNPALVHGAGENRSADILRMANLLQISSAFGRAMEAVNRVAMCAALYPVLVAERAAGRLSAREAANVIAASAEGYAFPTNLDRDPPVGGLAPASQADIMDRALAAGEAPARFEAALRDLARRRET